MRAIRRFIWWKCLFWAAVGAGLGAGAASWRQDVGIPAGAERVMPERLVVTLGGTPTPADAATDVVVYPPHGTVRMITFDFRSAGKTTSAYTLANTPFLTAAHLQNIVKASRHLSLQSLGSPSLVYATTLRTAADRAIVDVLARPAHQWATPIDFLDHVKAARAGFVYASAWWAEPAYRRDLPVALGLVLVGGLGAVLTRRSVADLAAADLLRTARASAATPSAAAGITGQDLRAVEALDALLEARLNDAAAGTEEAPVDAVEQDTPAAAAAGPVKLSSDPLAALAPATKEEKDYAGEYYPTVRITPPKGFSLIELLVSIGIIGLLIALLLPALLGARRSADTIACAANLRGIGQGLMLYLQQNQNTFPPAYLYIGQTIVNGQQTPTNPSAGYVHWSSYLYDTGMVNSTAFQCPAMHLGGLPPTNTPPANRDPGQVCPSDTITDQQAPRLAYTVNEVLCPRNKFVTASFGGSRVYHYVNVSQVAHSSRTILGTEMIDSGSDVSYGVAGTGWIMSHRPLSGYVGVNGELDMYLLPVGTPFRAATAADLDPNPLTISTATQTRLDLVGRNHGKGGGYPDSRLSNFLYVDGHVETKSIYDTMQPFEWGEQFYSLSPNNDQVMP